MPSQTHALPPAEPTPALAALAEVFGGAHASPPQRQTTASFRCVKSAGAHAVKPRARQAPELSDRCAPRLAFPETGPTRVSSSPWHDCVQQALASIAATTTTARSLGASAPRRPVGANRATGKQARSRLRKADVVMSSGGAESRGHAELATRAERACRQFWIDCEADVKVQMAIIHSKQALRHDEARSFVRSSAG